MEEAYNSKKLRGFELWRLTLNQKQTEASTKVKDKDVDNIKNISGKKICLFFGAGASADGGYRTFLTFPHMFWPTSTEPAILKSTDKERVLLAAIRRELERKRKPLTLDQYLWILDNYHVVLRSSFSDEELRSRFSDSLFFWSKMQELNQLVQRVRKHICDLTITHYKEAPQKHYYKSMRNFYSELFNKFQNVELFTTNYDIVPEYLMSKNQWFYDRLEESWDETIDSVNKNSKQLGDVNFFNGIRNFSNLDLNIDIESNSKHYEWHKEAYQNSESPSFSVFRLHGCVCWFYTPQLRNSEVYFDVKRIDQIANSYDRICIMYPGKMERVGKYPHRYGFERLYDACLNFSTLIFVGFAFRDSDVGSVIFSALRQRRLNRQKPIRIIIIDPYISKEDFFLRIEQMRQDVPVPMEIDDVEGAFKLITIRNKFPPHDPRELKIILDAIDANEE